MEVMAIENNPIIYIINVCCFRNFEKLYPLKLIINDGGGNALERFHDVELQANCFKMRVGVEHGEVIKLDQFTIDVEVKFATEKTFEVFVNEEIKLVAGGVAVQFFQQHWFLFTF